MRTTRTKFIERKSFRTSTNQLELLKKVSKETGIAEADLIRIAIDKFISQETDVIKAIYENEVYWFLLLN